MDSETDQKQQKTDDMKKTEDMLQEIQHGTRPFQTETMASANINVLEEKFLHANCGIMDSLLVKMFFFMLDILLDLVVILNNLQAGCFTIAFTLTVVLCRSLLNQMATGGLTKAFEALSASAAKGVMRRDLIDLFNEEKSEAFLSLCVSCYTFPYATRSMRQVLIQLVSIGFSAYNVQAFLYEQVDLDMVDA